MEERQRRAGLNEAVFREVNERINDLQTHLEARELAVDEELILICECAEAACTERITVSAGAYEQVRADGTRFLVAPGHVAPDVEHVVDEGREYDVVEKNPGPAAKLADETDPRSLAS